MHVTELILSWYDMPKAEFDMMLGTIDTSVLGNFGSNYVARAILAWFSDFFKG